MGDKFFDYLGCKKWHQRLRVRLVRRLLKSLAKEKVGFWIKLSQN